MCLIGPAAMSPPKENRAMLCIMGRTPPFDFARHLLAASPASLWKCLRSTPVQRLWASSSCKGPCTFKRALRTTRNYPTTCLYAIGSDIDDQWRGVIDNAYTKYHHWQCLVSYRVNSLGRVTNRTKRLKAFNTHTHTWSLETLGKYRVHEG